MKVKPKLKNGIISVTVRMSHEMTTYNMAEKKTGDRNNANFIEHISATLKSSGDTVLDMSTSQFISKNPIFKFKFKGAEAGDTVLMTWTDKSGKSKSGKGKIKGKKKK